MIKEFKISEILSAVGKISEIERELKSIHQSRVIDEIKIRTNRKDSINVLAKLGAELDKYFIEYHKVETLS